MVRGNVKAKSKRLGSLKPKLSPNIRGVVDQVLLLGLRGSHGEIWGSSSSWENSTSGAGQCLREGGNLSGYISEPIAELVVGDGNGCHGGLFLAEMIYSVSNCALQTETILLLG